MNGRTRRSGLIGALIEAGHRQPARIRDTVLAVLLAVHHTTAAAVAVARTLHLLGRHPEAAERVSDELDRVLDDRTVPDYADLRRLTYGEMVLKESLRLYPPGPYGARETAGAPTLGGHRISAGTVFFYPFWAVHLDPVVPEAELVLAVLPKRSRFRAVPGHEVTPVECFVLWGGRRHPRVRQGAEPGRAHGR